MGSILYNGTSYGGGGGSEVVANPSGTATDDLEKLEVDGTIYEIPTGGGGTTVVANPSGTPTDTLSTIQIGNDIFEIEGGGSGGGLIETILWSGENSATMTLSDSFENYDFIMIIATAITSAGNYRITNCWSVDYLKDHINDGVRFGLTGDTWYVYFSITNNTTFTRQDQNIAYISEIKGLKISGSGGSGTTSEIIPITAGDGTTSRTFTFDKTPKFIAYHWNDPVLENGWNTTAHFVWGQEFIAYSSATNVVSINNNYQGCLMATYNGNSVTFTGGNAFSVCNTINGTGLMYVDYGEAGGSGSSEKDISDMTWTQIISQTGGAWSSATAIPSGTEYLGIVIDHSSAVYMPKTLKLSELDKYASMLNYTIVREGIHWKHNTDQDDIYYEYDSANQTIKVYAGYSGLSVKVFAIS